MFHFYVNDWCIVWTNGWRTLAHVCQRWRFIAFASPRRLNLQLVYKAKRPMSEMPDVWPALPVAINYTFSKSNVDRCWGNIAAALESEHRERIFEITLRDIPTSHWENLATAMQKPFPQLTSLVLSAKEDSMTSLPDSFLGGSAPLLRELMLGNCPFPGLPKLHLLANHLVRLYLLDIPDSGYISPEALVTVLSAMSGLELLCLKFTSPRYPTSPPPLTRSVLPFLTKLIFVGIHEYLEDLLAQIQVPLLNNLEISFFGALDYVVPELHRLISHTESFKLCHHARLYSYTFKIQIVMFREIHQLLPDLSLDIKCTELDRQLSSLVQVCSSSLLYLISTSVRLELWGFSPPSQSYWNDHTETTRWLEFLELFTAVKDLRLGHDVGSHVCRALEGVAEGVEILPALQNIFLHLHRHEPSESVPKFLERFVAARKLSGHPVAIHRWD
ncbi:hypothetical protein F5148DRAFT_63362 [Russula earlei]|uniref:Uncharacterized protein n=1 Tax=Russula earlei TaxID=71964 RepID=A0ACC0U890_9AGAM|nr:hypothetical protein F5148DRAFT_63362 [Russula earlei]